MDQIRHLLHGYGVFVAKNIILLKLDISKNKFTNVIADRQQSPYGPIATGDVITLLIKLSFLTSSQCRFFDLSLSHTIGFHLTLHLAQMETKWTRNPLS
jgi:hypothetical protein